MGPVSKRRGRPPKAPEERRGARLEVRLTAAEHERYTRLLGGRMADAARRGMEREARAVERGQR